MKINTYKLRQAVDTHFQTIKEELEHKGRVLSIDWCELGHINTLRIIDEVESLALRFKNYLE